MRHVELISPKDVQVVEHGQFAEDVAGYARQKIAALARYTREPILFVRVRLERHPDPAATRPVAAQASLDLNGRVLQVKVAAATAREAVDLLEARLRQRLVKSARNWQAIRGWVRTRAGR